MADDLVPAVRASAERLGVDPSDLLTAIGYETGGKMSPSIYGGKDGKYLGLIQFSPENQKKYGVTPDQSAPEQMQAVEAYLRDRGVKPGHGLLDVYAAINAGRVGRYNASDANNGGAPGTVADKVAGMAGHRMRANAMLGIEGGGQGTAVAPGQPGGGPATVAAPAAPMSLAPGAGDPAAGGPDQMAALMQSLAPIAALANEGAMPQMEAPAIRYASPPGLARARVLARAMSNRSLG